MNPCLLLPGREMASSKKLIRRAVKSPGKTRAGILYLSDKKCNYSPRTAAIPGRIFPSRYSSIAPPAVEI